MLCINKGKLLFTVSALVIFSIIGTACTKNSHKINSSSEATTGVIASAPSSLSSSGDSFTYNSDTVLRSPDKAVLGMGKELLVEYDVKYNQTIRFPHEGLIYQSHGAYAIDSLEEAREKYPDFPIPEKLGDYLFVDLTLNDQRTSNVFPNTLPPPKNEIEVLTNAENPIQYYLCYKNNSAQFRISLLPVYLEPDRDAFDNAVAGQAPWSLHSDVYLEEGTDDEIPLDFQSLLIAAEQGGDYAFLVKKLSGSDCLECDYLDISEEEALSIYYAIRKAFTSKL